jgi:hypothetical protein
MEIDWKKPGIAGGAAFVIALFSGAVARVGFGAILLRSTLGALAFGVIAAGAEALARRFLPELFASARPSSSDDGESSGAVDITITEENPHARGTTDPEFGQEGDVRFDRGESVEDSDEPGELEAVDEISGDDDGDSSSGLPSFEGVESTFTSAGTEATDDEDDEGSVPARGVSSVDIMGSQEEPEIVARAVRTLLKRDREG